MGKIIRPTYPAEFSIGLLILIFVFSSFLSHQIFEVPMHDLDQNLNVYFGMVLVGAAVIIMILIMWEEILFPIRIKEENGRMVFRNHRTKLKAQLLIYCSIPAIFTFIYLEYEVRPVRFLLWAAVCMIPPIVEKIISGINNYNDFLILSDNEIEYKNNEKEGCFQTKDVKSISILEKEGNITHKILLSFNNNDSVTIDLDEMELEAYYEYIYKFISIHYKHFFKESPSTH